MKCIRPTSFVMEVNTQDRTPEVGRSGGSRSRFARNCAFDERIDRIVNSALAHSIASPSPLTVKSRPSPRSRKHIESGSGLNSNFKTPAAGLGVKRSGKTSPALLRTPRRPEDQGASDPTATLDQSKSVLAFIVATRIAEPNVSRGRRGVAEAPAERGCADRR